MPKSEAKSNSKSTPLKITNKVLKLIKKRIQLLENKSRQHDDPCEAKLTVSPLRIRGGHGGTDMPFRMPSFKSDFPAVDAIAHIFRSFQEDWSHFKTHPLCSHSDKTESGFPCFVCCIRNVSIRTCKRKQTRMLMQPIEILSQFDQFKSLVNHDFTKEPENFKLMLEKTQDLISIYERNFLAENKNLNLQCLKCNEVQTLGSSNLMEITDKSKAYEEDPSTVIENAANNYCQEHSLNCSGKICISAKQKFLFVYFTEAKNMKIMLNYKIFGQSFKYKSHIREIINEDSSEFQTHFVHDDIQFFDLNGTIEFSTGTDFQKGIKLLILSRLESVENPTEEVGTFSKRALDSIRKKTMKITNPDKHLLELEKKREHSAIYEKQRYNTPKRKQYEEDFVSSGKRSLVEKLRK